MGSSLKLVIAILQNRWMVIVAGFLIMATSGATYNFGVYSQEVKTSLRYKQQTLNTLGVFKDLGSKVGIVSGLIYDVTGPWVVLTLGSGMNLSGYLMIWLAVVKRIATPPVWQMCLYIFLGANSQAFTNTGVVVTIVKNFPCNRGFLIGLLKGFVGLSGAMLNLVYKALYGTENPASFILLVAWFPSAVCLSFAFVIRRMQPSDKSEANNEKKILYFFLGISLVLAAYLMVIIIVEHLHGVNISSSAFKALATVMAAIVFLPLGIPIRQELQKRKARKEQHLDGKQSEMDPPKEQLEQGAQAKQEQEQQPQESKFDAEEQALEVKRQGDRTTLEENMENSAETRSLWKRIQSVVWKRPSRGDDYNILQAVFSIDMLIIFVCTTCGFGPALMVIDNLGQVGDSLGYSSAQVGTFVSLFSIWSFLGRVGAGLISDIFLQRNGTPRTLFFSLVLAIAAVGHLLIAFNVKGALFTGSILIGLSYGGQLSLMYILISELFGLKYYGTLYNVGNMASPLGSYIFSVLVAGMLYDREAVKKSEESSSEDDLFCRGTSCFRLTFIITTCVCVFGFLIASILTLRTRKFYRELSRK